MHDKPYDLGGLLVATGVVAGRAVVRSAAELAGRVELPCLTPSNHWPPSSRELGRVTTMLTTYLTAAAAPAPRPPFPRWRA